MWFLIQFSPDLVSQIAKKDNLRFKELEEKMRRKREMEKKLAAENEEKKKTSFSSANGNFQKSPSKNEPISSEFDDLISALKRGDVFGSKRVGKKKNGNIRSPRPKLLY
eukprot:Sdes_comp9626_c0_seq1m1104